MFHFLYILYLASPAFVANMMPVLINRLGWFRFLAIPVDGGKKVFGERIFGANKTVRGFAVGIIGAVFTVLIQYILHKYWIIPYFSLDFWLVIAFGFWAGFGSLIGDAVESFIKRQIGVESGKPFIPFDQIDYIIGFLIATHSFMAWSQVEVLFLLFFVAVINPIANLIAYIFRIKQTYW